MKEIARNVPAKAENSPETLGQPERPEHQHDGKWWFWDETWTVRHGPYASRKEASAACVAYAMAL